MIIGLDTTNNTNSIRNPTIYNKQTGCIGYTIVSNCRMILMIMEAIVVVRSVEQISDVITI